MAVTRLRTFFDEDDGLIHDAVLLQPRSENPHAWPRYACDNSTTVGVYALKNKRTEDLVPTCVWCAAGRQWWR